MPPLLSTSSRRASRLAAPDTATSITSTTEVSSSTDDAAPPDYEPLSTPLNPKAQRALASLASATHFRALKDHIRQAGEKLTETAGEANEHATDARYRYEHSKRRKETGGGGNKSAANKKMKLKNAKVVKRDEEDGIEDGHEGNDHKDDEDEDDEEEVEEVEVEDEQVNEQRRKELERLEDLEAKVKLATSQLEERMRRVVDADYKVNGLQVAIQQVAADSETADAALNTSRRRLRRRERGTRNGGGADSDEEMDEHDDENRDEVDDRAPTVIPTRIIKERLTGHDNQWEQQSLTQRYTNNNAYVGFYRIVHDAKQLGDETNPVPHPSTWFNHLEPARRQPRHQGGESHARSTSNVAAHQHQNSGNNNVDDDDNNNDDEEHEEDDADIEIERERISLKCPLTLITFQDPVKSTKCVHSFERQAIEEMIKASSMTIPASEGDFQGGNRNARARRVRAVPCPVCSVPLAMSNLESDLVLARRVRRMRAAELREQEDVELGGDRRRQNGVMLDSDDGEDEDEDEDHNGGRNNQTRLMQQRDREIRIKREKSKLSRGPETVSDDGQEDEEMNDVGSNDDNEGDAEEDIEEEDDD